VAFTLEKAKAIIFKAKDNAVGLFFTVVGWERKKVSFESEA